MLDEIVPLPEDPEELRAFTARLLAEVKAQAILIEKLRHQLAGHRAHRFGASSETAEQLQLALETSEIAAAAMTARLRLPDVEEKGRPKRRPIPDHVPRMEVELSPAADACADCGGKLRRIGEDVTEELEYVPGRFIVNRIVRPRLACAVLRALRPGAAAVAPHRARPPRSRAARPCAGQQVRRPSSPLSPEPDLRARRAGPRPLHARRLGRKVHRAAGAAGRRHRPARARGRGDLRRRHAGPHAGARHGQDPDRPALDLCPRRAPLGRRARRRPRGIASRATGRGSIRRTISPASAAGCMPTATPGFEDLYRSGAIREVACMAHVRRKFVDIHRSQASPIAEEAIQRIARLYAVEKEARGSPPDRRVRDPPSQGRPGRSMISRRGSPSSCPASPASRPSPPRSATP